MKEKFTGEIFRKILGDEAAMRLRLWRPPHISQNNLIVFSYFDDIDGAFMRGELDIKEDSSLNHRDEIAQNKKVE